jgi:cytochrome oxidase assembly protein ShyY1
VLGMGWVVLVLGPWQLAKLAGLSGYNGAVRQFCGAAVAPRW